MQLFVNGAAAQRGP